jgi:hypothetical protein
MPTSTALANRAKETLVVSPDLKDAVRRRESLNDDELAAHIEGAILTLRLVAPLVEEMKRRFQNLDRSKQVDGTYKTIGGCRSFKKFCETVLHRTEQAVYLMLRKDDSSKSKEKSESKTKRVKEYQALVDAVPPVRKGKEYIKPSEYSASDVAETITKFAENLLGQPQFSDVDKKSTYRTLARHFQHALTEMP